MFMLYMRGGQGAVVDVLLLSAVGKAAAPATSGTPNDDKDQHGAPSAEHHAKKLAGGRVHALSALAELCRGAI